MFKNLLRKTLRNEKGFTMMEAMIIAGLLAVLITTFASYQYQRARQTKINESKKDYSQLQNNVKSTANQSESLTQTEDLQFAFLTGTATPAPVVAPDTADATPPPCETGCTLAGDGVCEISGSCLSSGTCPAGCRIVGSLPPTSTSSSSTGSTAGTSTAGTTTGGTTAGTSTAGTTTSGTVKCAVAYCSNLFKYTMTCNNDGTSSRSGKQGACGAEPQGSSVNCSDCSIVAATTTGGSTTGACTSTNDCENSMRQCVDTRSIISCSGSPSINGRPDCACPGKYIYPNPPCPPANGVPATQCYIR